MNQRKVLVLNQDFTFLGVTDWKNAICSVYTNTCIVEEEYEDEVHSVSVTWKVPAVIRLKRYVRIAYERLAYVSYSKRNVHLRDNYTCQYCGIKDKKGLTIDHVVPESRGGLNVWSNVITCCSSCNSIKDDRTPEEVGLKLIRTPTKPKGFKEVIRIKIGEINNLWTKYL